MNGNAVLTTAVVGMDVAKKKVDLFAVLHDKGKAKVFDNTATGHREIQRWLGERGFVPDSTHVCMEATGPYSESLATALVAGGWKVSVVNPARIKGFAQSELARNKTDRADAALLARFCQALRPALWVPPSAAFRQLRAWVDRLQALKDMRQQELNRIEAMDASEQREVLTHVNKHVMWLDQEIVTLEGDIDDHIDGHPALKVDADLMASIPGLGRTTVAKVLAYAGDVRRFDSAKALAAFIGLSPRQRHSGSSVRGHTMMSRTGHKALRRALYMPGLVARRHNKALKLFGDRLSAAGLAPKAVVGRSCVNSRTLFTAWLNRASHLTSTMAYPYLTFKTVSDPIRFMRVSDPFSVYDIYDDAICSLAIRIAQAISCPIFARSAH